MRASLCRPGAVLGGTQSLHTDAYDEALALPTEEAARIALRTQQIIAYESGCAQTVDPLEKLLRRETNPRMKCVFDIREAHQMGAWVKAIERGFPQREIAEASYQYQRALKPTRRSRSAVNYFVIEEARPISLHRNR